MNIFEIKENLKILLITTSIYIEHYNLHFARRDCQELKIVRMLNQMKNDTNTADMLNYISFAVVKINLACNMKNTIMSLINWNELA